MTWFRQFAFRLRALFRRGQLDADMAEEMRLHLELRTQRNLAAGMSSDEASYAAQRGFGGAEQIKERARDQRGWRWIEYLGQDLRHASRSLRRSPGLVITATLSLGLGIGLNLTLFAGISAALFSVPTAQNAGRLVGVEPGNSNRFTYPNFLDLRASGIFEDAVAFYPDNLNLRSGDNTTKVTALVVSDNFFAALGLQAQTGRVFSADEAAAEREPRLAVLGDTFARRQFGDGVNPIGQSLNLSGESFLVLGVLPKSLRAVTAVTAPDIYVPLSARLTPNLNSRRTGSGLQVLAYLRPGTDAPQAQAAVTVWGTRMEKAYPDENAGASRPAKVYPVRGAQLQGAPQEFFVFSATLLVLFVLLLLIACANVAGLLLARAATRRRELAVRMALGASRRRLIQSMLVESCLLAALGAAAGLALTAWLLPVLGSVALPNAGPTRLVIKPDYTLALLGATMALATGIVCGLIPALRATRANLVQEIQQGSAHGATARLWLRQAFVVGQVAAAVTLLAVSFLFLRSLMRIATLSPGFDVTPGLVARIDLDKNRFTNPARLLFADEIVRRLEGIPGVQSVTLANLIPLAGDTNGGSFTAPGVDATRLRTYTNSVGPRYFETIGIALRQGREFRAGDMANAPPVVIINEAFARHFFPGENPVGHRIAEPQFGTASPIEFEIVGVVSDTKHSFLSEPPQPLVYYAYAQRPGRLTIHLRISGDPTASIATVRQQILSLDPSLAVNVQTLREATSFEFTMRRIGSGLLGSLGALGLALATIGLYGVMSFVVASRTMEIGIRMALGATARRVVREIIAQGMKTVGIGLGLGLLCSFLLAQLLGSFLAGLSPADPLAFGGTIAALTFTGLAACYLPARRAAKVDPMIALRSE